MALSAPSGRRMKSNLVDHFAATRQGNGGATERAEGVALNPMGDTRPPRIALVVWTNTDIDNLI